MNLYLIRHAIAEERENFAKRNSEDSLRPLTLKGRKKMLKVLSWMSPWLKSADLIVSSPYTRAKQTAELIRPLCSKAKIIEALELVPQSPPQAFQKWLKAHARDKKNVIVVGHEPQLSILMSYLLCNKNTTLFELKKSGMACIEIENVAEIETAKSQLMWMIQPKLLPNI